SAGASRRTPPTTGKPASSRLGAAAPRQPKAPAAAKNTRRSMESIMLKPPLSGDWRQLEQGGVAGAFRQHPQSAVGTDLDITQALLALGQQPLFTYDPVPIQRQPRKMPTGKTSDKQTAFPGRRRIGVVKGHPGRGDHRIPIVDGLEHPLRLGDPGADRFTGIFDAICDDRPAVVAAGFWNVELIPSARTVFVGPQSLCNRMNGCALHVAMAVR